MKRLPPLVLTGILAISWLALAAVGCATDVDKNDHLQDDIFSIYLPTQELDRGSPPDLGSITLQEEPWLSVEDIDYYDFSTHFIYLTTDKDSLFHLEPQDPRPSSFVVVAGGERCYLGYFHSLVSSLLPTTPTISYDPDFDFHPDDIIRVGRGMLDGSVDPRGDVRIRDALARAGKLNPGLSVQLSDVSIDTSGSATAVRYVLSVTNESDDALYVPDAGSMGAGLLDYYAGGLIVFDSERHSTVLTAYEPSVEPQPYDSWEVSWFARLNRGETMSRTVEYECAEQVNMRPNTAMVRYTGPYHIDRGQRTLPDGRLWLGSVEARTADIRVIG